MNDIKHDQGNMIEFIVNWLNDIAGVSVGDSVSEKVRLRIVSLLKTSDIRLYAIVNDFQNSDDPELHKIAERISPFVSKGKYSKLFDSTLAGREIEPYTLEQIQKMQPFGVPGRNESELSLSNIISRLNEREYTSLSDTEITMLDEYDRIARGAGFFISMVFSSDNEQKQKELSSMAPDEKNIFCQKKNPKIYVRSFVKDK
ncbi:hypothetical protein KKJ04_20950 [Xenorhabdus bovienii]|uniref:hypothetical protein n=1 Tax=Xenorhabdus bovienii TaxID=40576 RepID=UPI0023B21FD4|nr:hypothetical protein [Xenorhabdus bovienii]MDE9447929.1 hypothetical protein [Xenorhabdus bovienii]